MTSSIEIMSQVLNYKNSTQNDKQWVILSHNCNDKGQNHDPEEDSNNDNYHQLMINLKDDNGFWYWL